VAVYSSNPSASGDLITGSPGATLQDYFDAITLGTLDLTAGFAAGSDDFITSISLGALTFDDAANTGILSKSPSNTVAFTTGGLSILQNFTQFDFLENVQSDNPLAGGPTLHQLAITAGSTSGAHGVTPADFDENFTNVPGFSQCVTAAGAAVPCGFTDNADFSLFPVAVPEPGTVALLGIGLLGFAGIQRRLKLH
jgi:hypothetical protein